jgi:hypothetical protein
MNIILENIRKVLLENRVDDVKKKYPEVDPAIIDYFVKEDPSGNNKYLDWLVKAMTHGPTIQSVEDILDEAMQFNTPQEFLMMLVKKFHELLPYMVYVEDGKKVGTTDLYQYKFTDSEMINFLGFDLSQAKERKDEKNKQKDAKKNSDKIYEDKNWLVVRPKNWESSCVYGAGTKWCTTSKENSSHFKRETDRNFLIYVINKNKTSKDTEYKVAWQIPYTKKVNKYVTSTPGNPSVWTLNTDKIKLWNAEDTNIASRGSSGYDYLDTVPASVKGNILKYMQRQMDEMYANMAYVEDPYTQALVEHLALSEEEVEEVEQRDYGYYGMRVYTVDGSDDYAVATTDEVERAKHEWAENYINDLGIWEAIGNNPEKYIYINDPRTIANDMAENYIGDLNVTDDILHEGKRLDKETKAMVEEWEVNQSIMETNQEDIDDMMERYGELDEDEEQELSELEIENESIEKTNDKLLQSIKDRIRDDYYETYVTRMTDDPLDWLEEFGYWSSKTGLDKFAIKNGLVGIDETELINDMADDLDYEYFSRTGNYEYVNIEGDRYYIFPTD